MKKLSEECKRWDCRRTLVRETRGVLHVYSGRPRLGQGGAPFCTTGFELLARVTLHLTEVKTLGDFFSAGKLTTPLRVNLARLKQHKGFSLQRENGVTRANDHELPQTNSPNVTPA